MANVLVKGVRVAFLNKALKAASIQGTGGAPKYSVSLVWPAGEAPASLVEAVKAAIAETWPQGLPADARKPIRTGETKNWLPEGHDFVNCSSAEAPTIFNTKGESISMPNDPELVSGAVCDVLVGVYTYNKAGNKGVGYGLEAIKITDAAFEPLQGGKPSEQDYRAMLGVSDAQPSTPAATANDNPW